MPSSSRSANQLWTRFGLLPLLVSAVSSLGGQPGGRFRQSISGERFAEYANTQLSFLSALASMVSIIRSRQISLQLLRKPGADYWTAKGFATARAANSVQPTYRLCS